jgi:hypothetical protein
MKIDKTLKIKITKDIGLSLIIYALPVLALYLYYRINNGVITDAHATIPSWLAFIKPAFENIRTWGLTAFLLILGLIEFGFGLYDNKWTASERNIDIACFFGSKVLLSPVIAFFSLKFLPTVFSGLENTFAWVPFWGGITFFMVVPPYASFCTLHGNGNGFASKLYIYCFVFTNLFSGNINLFRAGITRFVCDCYKKYHHFIGTF